MNEGFTTYLTGRIMEEVYGESYENMLKLRGEIDLREEVDRMGPDSADTRLKLNMEGRIADGYHRLTMIDQSGGSSGASLPSAPSSTSHQP